MPFYTFAGQWVPKAAQTQAVRETQCQGPYPSSGFTEVPKLLLSRPLSESSRTELRGGNRKSWPRCGEDCPSLSPKCCIFGKSGQICPCVLSGLCWGICKQKRYWLRSRNALLAHSPASWRCLHLQAPGKCYTDPPRHCSALGKPAWVSTLWQREVLKCIFEDVWTDLFERQLELWSNPDVSPCLGFEGRVCLQASDL